MSRIKLVIAEDHALLRQGVRHLLAAHNPDLSIIAEVGNGRDLVQAVAEYDPDVVLVDVNMPVMNGIDATRAIRAAESPCRVLILTGYEDATLYRMAMDAGANGFVHKSADQKELAQAIDTVLAGGTYVDKTLAAAVERTDSQRHVLTRRELEVLELVARGLKSKDIAERLFISVKTVEKHRSNILRKAGVHSVARLVAWAREAGLLMGADSGLPLSED